MYNVKHFAYPDGYETRMYSRCYDVGKFERIENDDQDDKIREPFHGEEKTIETFEMFDKRRERSMMTSRNRTINNVYSLARCNDWDWFITITFDPSKIDSFDYSIVTEKLSNWLSNLRSADSSIKYIFVPEQHKSGAYHFHGLLNDSSALGMSYSGHDTKSGDPIYNVGRYRFGFTTATRVENNVAVTKYITKYITKDLIDSTKGKKRFWASRNLERPEESKELLELNDRLSLEAELEGRDDVDYKQVIVQAGSAEVIRYYNYPRRETDEKDS